MSDMWIGLTSIFPIPNITWWSVAGAFPIAVQQLFHTLMIYIHS
jgi:hypothetical protein